MKRRVTSARLTNNQSSIENRVAPSSAACGCGMPCDCDCPSTQHRLVVPTLASTVSILRPDESYTNTATVLSDRRTFVKRFSISYSYTYPRWSTARFPASSWPTDTPQTTRHSFATLWRAGRLPGRVARFAGAAASRGAMLPQLLASDAKVVPPDRGSRMHKRFGAQALACFCPDAHDRVHSERLHYDVMTAAAFVFPTRQSR